MALNWLITCDHQLSLSGGKSARPDGSCRTPLGIYFSFVDQLYIYLSCVKKSATKGSG
jgi:hypothetical protein